MYLIEPPAQPSLAVEGMDNRFPVHRIYCVGRNYADHAIEMGHNPDEEPPFFFMKPADTLVPEGQHFDYPSLTEDLQHEVEMVVALARGGANIAEDKALDCVMAYGVGIDLTRRDLQGEAKAKGRPWDSGKAFDQSAPCSDLILTGESKLPEMGDISLKINGKIRQQADINQMIWKVPQVIARLSCLFTLMPGDLIYTGTPAGVGPVQKGDLLEASLFDQVALHVACR